MTTNMTVDKRKFSQLPGRLRRNDPEAELLLWRLLQQHAARILGKDRKPEGLEDCLSRAFLIIVAKVQQEGFRADNFLAFCTEVLKRCWWDEQKKQRRHQHSELPLIMPDQDSGPRARSLEELLQQNGQDGLLRWLRGLRLQDRMLLELQLQGYGHREIAELSGLSYGHVRNRYAQLMKEAGRKCKRGE